MKIVNRITDKKNNIKTHILIGVFMLFICMFIGTKDVKAGNTIAQLPKGEIFNLLIKQSVKSSVTNYTTPLSSTYVTKITFTTEKPTNYNKTSDKLSSYGVDIYIKGTELYLYNPVGFISNEDSSCMFYGFGGVQEILFNSFDTKNVRNMSYMFYNCMYLSNSDMYKFKTNNVTNMSYMFYQCFRYATSNMTTLNLNNWNTENVTDMSYMFYGCS